MGCATCGSRRRRKLSNTNKTPQTLAQVVQKVPRSKIIKKTSSINRSTSFSGIRNRAVRITKEIKK